MASDCISNTLKSKTFPGWGGMPPDPSRTWELHSHFAFVRNSILAPPPPLPPSSFTLKSLLLLTRTPEYAVGTNTQKFKKIKGSRTTTSKCRLINYAYFRPHQRTSKREFWLNSYNIRVLVPIQYSGVLFDTSISSLYSLSTPSPQPQYSLSTASIHLSTASVQSQYNLSTASVQPQYSLSTASVQPQFSLSTASVQPQYSLSKASVQPQ